MPKYYKVLRLNANRQGPLSCYVSSDNEDWSSLEIALNELGATGWEINFPVYGPVPGRDHQGDSWLEALVLVNRNSDAAQGLERRIQKIKQIIADTEVILQRNKEKSPEYRAAKDTLENTKNYLQQLLEEQRKASVG